MELNRRASNLDQDQVRAGFAHFVSCRDDATLQIAVESLGDFPDGLGRDVLIAGPPKCGKTSMLFHCASKYAENGMHVIMLLRRAKVESHPPCLPPLSIMDDECYNRVHIKYVNHLDNLRKFLSCAHLCKVNASAILLDDLSSYICDDLQESRMRSYESCLARVLAELKEAANAIARRNGSPCGLVVTDRGNDEGPSHRYVYERWLPLVLCSSPQGNGCYNLSQIARQEVQTHHGAVQYRIDDERFALERILAAPSRTTTTKGCWTAG